MRRTSTLTLLLVTAASFWSRTPPDIPFPGTAPASQASAAASAEGKLLPDSVHVIVKESFPVIDSKKAEDKTLDGTVVFAVTIGKHGMVREIYFISGPPMLTKTGWDAVRQWRNKPYIYGGNPVACDTRIQVNFTLASL
jgi:outer membrane biosynthesis protein TonB